MSVNVGGGPSLRHLESVGAGTQSVRTLLVPLTSCDSAC